jgi:hypothetical protein
MPGVSVSLHTASVQYKGDMEVRHHVHDYNMKGHSVTRYTNVNENQTISPDLALALKLFRAQTTFQFFVTSIE